MLSVYDDAYQVFKESVLHWLRKWPMGTKELYAFAKDAHPDLCDDDYKCVHRPPGTDVEEPEWHHSLRSAQGALVKKGLIIPPKNKNSLWHAADTG